MRLKDKVAIVTGAGQTKGETTGNGRATACRFAEEGARILVLDVDVESGEETVEMIRSQDGEAVFFECDVSAEEQVQAAVSFCVREYTRIDILHNNVGITAGDAMTVDLAEQDWRRILDVNLTSMFLMAKHVLPVMRMGGGSIINISSTASLCWPRQLAYKTSKAAINALTEHLALDNAEYGVRANAILPGLLDTPMAIEKRALATGQSRDSVRAERAARVPLATIGTAADIANAALFLASDESRYISGVLLPVDGALSARRG